MEVSKQHRITIRLDGARAILIRTIFQANQLMPLGKGGSSVGPGRRITMQSLVDELVDHWIEEWIDDHGFPDEVMKNQREEVEAEKQ